MPLNENAYNLFKGFSKLDYHQRIAKLQEMGALNANDIDAINTPLNIGLSEKLIENSIGYFQLPLGVATNFKIDGKDYIIPMAVEETSIIAALCKTAKWICTNGSIKTKIEGDTIIGQLQIAKVQDFQKLSNIIQENKLFLIEHANAEVAAGLVKRGGGIKDIQLRKVTREDQYTMAVIHILTDCCDAMGANILNQILEFLKPPIENLSGEKIDICILSNLNDTKLTHAEVNINNVEPKLGEAIQEASLFANLDPYRAATNNKGVLNGIDPILIATGNDWRAVDAAVHAFAARDGQYRSITKWSYQDGILTGKLSAPIIVGIVGGVTKLHPTAQTCLKMLDIKSANELSRIIAATGLTQNLGALKALCTDGIIQGHMKLHIDNLTLSAGALEDERAFLKTKLEEWLKNNKRVSLSNAISLLKEIRTKEVRL